jgi:two-component system, LytTR family, sensor kinase
MASITLTGAPPADATSPAAHRATAEPRATGVVIARTEALLIFAFWTFLALLTAANRLLDPRGPALQPAFGSAPVALAFIESYLWAALTPAIFWLSSRFTLERGSRVARALMFIAVGILVAVLVDASMGTLRAHAFNLPRRFSVVGGPWVSFRRLWFVNDLVMFMAVLATGVARDYFMRYRARQEESVRLQAQAAQLQAQLAEARLAVLRSQLNPHFLFNTLNAVSTLVERDPRGVRRMIARLSELLRYTLEDTTQQEIPLEKEIALLRQYVEIMEIRFQGHLEVGIAVAPDARDALVPNLVLQPLVENALKHGVSRVNGTGRIDIEARRVGAGGETLLLTVRDNGPQGRADTPAEASSGVGLRNTRSRLEQLYGARQHLELRPAEVDGARAEERAGMVAEIAIPYHTRADLHATEVPSPA